MAYQGKLISVEMHIDYKVLYEKEKEHAGDLRDELNSADIIHYDECANLRVEIVFLKQQLKMKKVH